MSVHAMLSKSDRQSGVTGARFKSSATFAATLVWCRPGLLAPTAARSDGTAGSPPCSPTRMPGFFDTFYAAVNLEMVSAHNLLCLKEGGWGTTGLAGCRCRRRAGEGVG